LILDSVHLASQFTAYLADAADGASYVKLAGEFDIAGRDLADEVLASANGARKIVLDLSDLEFIDSMGIHFVVTAHQAAEAEGRELKIVRGGPQVTRIFELVGLDDVLPFEDAAA
jgi:anti-sigma B factor antagonist